MMRTTIALFTLCLAGCPRPTQEAAVRSAVAYSPARCYDPAQSGAMPDDGVSDRQAIQVAMDALESSGGTVCLGPGRWTLDRAPDGSYNNHAGLATHGRNVSLVGAGENETFLELPGDQGGHAVVVVSVDPGAEHFRVSDLTVDTTASTNTHEQTHAYGTSGACSGETCRPIRDVRFERVGCIHPRNTPSRKGDCFRLLGNTPDTEVYDVRIEGVHVEDAARSAVELQRGLNGVVISGSTFNCKSCDQIIDGEATGGGWTRRVLIDDNVLTSGPDVQGGFAIACTSCEDSVISNNTLDRGIALYRTRRVVVEGNAVTLAATDRRAVIEAHNLCEGLVVDGNTLERSGTAGPIVDLGPHSGATCSGASVSGNVMTQRTAAPAVAAASSSRVSIATNVITHAMPAPGHGSIYVRAAVVGAPIHAVSISANVISGPVTSAVRLSAHPGQFGSGISVSGNIAVGVDRGLTCEDANFAAPIASSGNAWPASWAGAATIGSGSP